MRRSRLLAMGLAAALGAITLGLGPVSASAGACPQSVANKTYCAVLSPASVGAGTRSFTLKVGNEAPLGTTQAVGSFQATVPAGSGFTITGTSLGACSQKNPPSPCAATTSTNVQVNGTSILPGTSYSITLTVSVPAAAGGSTWTWTTTAQQASSNNCSANTCNPFTLNGNDSSLTTTVVQSADLGIASDPGSPTTVDSGNPVLYTLTVTNGGPQTSGPITVSDTASNGTLTSISGVNAGGGTSSWSCSISGGTGTCTHAAVTSGASIEKLQASVTAGSPGTMSNTATVSETSVSDANPANNSATATTTVAAAGSCSSTSNVSCATGTIVYSQPSSIVSGAASDVSLTKFIVARVDFPAVNASGSQLFSINAPSNPSLQTCPIQPLAQPCTWLNHADIVPLQYVGSIVTETLIIDSSHGGGRPQFVFHSNDDGSNVQQWTNFSTSSDGTTCSATKTTECVAANFVDSSGRSIVVVHLAPGDGNIFGLPW